MVGREAMCGRLRVRNSVHQYPVSIRWVRTPMIATLRPVAKAQAIRTMARLSKAHAKERPNVWHAMSDPQGVSFPQPLCAKIPESFFSSADGSTTQLYALKSCAAGRTGRVVWAFQHGWGYLEEWRCVGRVP